MEHRALSSGSTAALIIAASILMALLMAGLVHLLARDEEVAIRVMQALAGLSATAFVLLDWLRPGTRRIPWGIGAAMLLFATGMLAEGIWGVRLLPLAGIALGLAIGDRLGRMFQARYGRREAGRETHGSADTQGQAL